MPRLIPRHHGDKCSIHTRYNPRVLVVWPPRPRPELEVRLHKCRLRRLRMHVGCYTNSDDAAHQRSIKESEQTRNYWEASGSAEPSAEIASAPTIQNWRTPPEG